MKRYEVIIIGGGHAGVEAAWAAANLLPVHGQDARATVALVTLDPSKIGVMSCNPAIGGLAKGQIVREIDALGGLMGLATDATGIQFKVLNSSKGAAVRGPRAQCDKHAYAEAVQMLIASRPEIEVIAGSVERLVVERGKVRGVVVRKSGKADAVEAARNGHLLLCPFEDVLLSAPGVVLTTGTFMRGLMHTGEQKSEGGRYGEAAAVGISGALRELGFELGRLKTGTPPRLKRATIDWDALEPAPGDDVPVPFSELSRESSETADAKQPISDALHSQSAYLPSALPFAHLPFPHLPQVECRVTRTTAAAHDAIRANLHRAPMYSGQIESIGPRYCPSIEDKVTRFADRDSHNVFLEPESLRDDWVYCNGVSTSLPADVQDTIVRAMPGCERADILRYGYAVEYDMVKPHQIFATGMTKLVEGLFLAGQINGTSGYEEAAGQGVISGINAARFARNEPPFTLSRDAAYIGVMMDDLVTKTPTEPYRMFTSRAEHRLMLRADNAPDRLTSLAESLGLLASHPLGELRRERFAARRAAIDALSRCIDTARLDLVPLRDLVRRPEFGPETLAAAAIAVRPPNLDDRIWRDAVFTVHTERFYEAYIERQRAEVRRHADLERRRIPNDFVFDHPNLRTEARQALARFRPETLGQAARLEGITPADITLLAVLIKRRADAQPA
ncbi:MAG: tRNA uridine-5-carboxymethylaminomethyl(34) synthesis enzyme MnmG [Phycisphaeraceae bacterium]|nr:tRNA uridine-5-carboxymethylaminomethyl(34) synthesis enzyme MnmG [Phycisphaeraceae bacterium]